MVLYDKLWQLINGNTPVLLVSEANDAGSVKHSFYQIGNSMLPEIALEAQERKELVWREDKSGGWQKAELFFPSCKLYLLGGGHISHAVAAIAALVDFPVIIIEDRPEFANRQRFPQAQEIICRQFSEALPEIKFNPSSFVVVATRGHRYDQDCLPILLRQELAYIGMVGSKSRVRAMKKDLMEMGIDEVRLESLHSPVGIDIKAKTPAEIAVSIMAEIIEVKRTLFPTEEADKAVLEEAREVERSGQRAVMATIVDTKGSSPRKPGARMLIYPDGRVLGTIGGGCGEGEVKREALGVLDEARAKVYRLDLTADLAAEEGMACGGIMRVLLEPLG